jgi:hypothetical protein
VAPYPGGLVTVQTEPSMVERTEGDHDG